MIFFEVNVTVSEASLVADFPSTAPRTSTEGSVGCKCCSIEGCIELEDVSVTPCDFPEQVQLLEIEAVSAREVYIQYYNSCLFQH